MRARVKCPYGLDTPTLLAKNLEDYKNVLAGKTSVISYNWILSVRC